MVVSVARCAADKRHNWKDEIHGVHTVCFMRGGRRDTFLWRCEVARFVWGSPWSLRTEGFNFQDLESWFKEPIRNNLGLPNFVCKERIFAALMLYCIQKTRNKAVFKQAPWSKQVVADWIFCRFSDIGTLKVYNERPTNQTMPSTRFTKTNVDVAITTDYNFVAAVTQDSRSCVIRLCSKLCKHINPILIEF